MGYKNKNSKPIVIDRDLEELGLLTEQLAEKAEQKTVSALKKVSNNSQLESREVVAYPDATTIDNFRFDLTNVKPYSVDMTKNDAADPAYYRPIPFERPNTLDFDYFEIKFRTPDISKFLGIQFRVVPDNNKPTEYYIMNMDTKIPFDSIPNELITMRFNKRELIASPTTPTSPIMLTATGHVEFRISGQVGLKMKLENGITGVKVKTPVVIQFDDGHHSIYEKAFPAMKERGIVGTFNIVSSWVGIPDFCTYEQLKEMQDAGWSICNHTDTHLDLVSIPLADAIKEVETCERYLSSNGFTGSHILAPPYNAFSDTLEHRMRHILKSRKYGNVYSGNVVNYRSLVKIESKSVKINEDLIPLYDDAVSKGLYFSPCFHHVLDNPSWDYSYNVVQFEQLLDYMIQQNAHFINMEHYVDRLLISNT